MVITHDIDSKTGIDSSYFYSTYEKSIGYKGHYFITTSMRHDSRGMNFYTPENLPKLAALREAGHTLGSHSVSHFPDMARKDFPKGYMGEYNRFTYNAVYNNGISTGGSMYGELEISRDVLTEDLGFPIHSFRAGHLVMHKQMPITLDSLGYTISSNLLSRAIRSSFPYLQRNALQTASLPTGSLFEYPLFIL